MAPESKLPAAYSTRLAVLAELAKGEARSIVRLTSVTNLTRQAVTRHLRVLESAGVVGCVQIGRESRFKLNPLTLAEARNYLEAVSRQWDDALSRLKSLVET